MAFPRIERSLANPRTDTTKHEARRCQFLRSAPSVYYGLPYRLERRMLVSLVPAPSYEIHCTAQYHSSHSYGPQNARMARCYEDIKAWQRVHIVVLSFGGYGPGAMLHVGRYKSCTSGSGLRILTMLAKAYVS